MSTVTVPYITATLIHDPYMDSDEPTAMHHHLIGHTVDSIHELRYPDAYHNGRRMVWSKGYSDSYTSWPMVDLWARVPESVFEYGVGNDETALRHAKRLQGITDGYTGMVGW